jgi:hypothetical protein
MTNKARRRHQVFFSVALLLTVSVVSLVVFSKIRQAPGVRSNRLSNDLGQRQFLKHLKPEEVTKLPNITSRIKGLEIVSATISDLATPQATLVVEVRNNTDLSVVCLNFFTESSDKVDMASPHDDGLENPAEVQVLVPPHDSKLFRWPTTALLDLQFPIAITAASFVNKAGTVIEMGDPFVLKVYQEEREQAKARRNAGKVREVRQ